MLAAIALAVVQGSIRCDQPGGSILQDMHDGDQKRSELSADGIVTITPYNNTQSWMVKAKWDPVHCNASIDFRVPGKPNPPPVPLTMTYYRGEGGVGQPTLFTAVFTDPSGTLAPSRVPVNAWLATVSFPPPRRSSSSGGGSSSGGSSSGGGSSAERVARSNRAQPHAQPTH